MAGDRKPWDLTSTKAISGAAGYLRRQSNAQMVLIIRKGDVGCSIDESLQPNDAITLLRNELPQLLQYLIDRRAKKLEGEGNGRV